MNSILDPLCLLSPAWGFVFCHNTLWVIIKIKYKWCILGDIEHAGIGISPSFEPFWMLSDNVTNARFGRSNRAPEGITDFPLLPAPKFGHMILLQCPMGLLSSPQSVSDTLSGIIQFVKQISSTADWSLTRSDNDLRCRREKDWCRYL